MVNQIKTGALLTYIAIFVNVIVGLIYTPFMLRTLGQSEYGIYSLANSVIAYLTVLDLGFGNAIIRYTAKFRAEGKVREQQEMLGMFMVLYLGIGIIALIVGSLLAINVNGIFSQSMNSDELYKTRIVMWLLTFNLAFTFPMSVWGSIMTAYERFIFLRLIAIIRSVLNPIVIVVLLILGYKAIGMVVVTTIFNVVTLSINFYYCKKKLSIQLIYGRYNFLLLKEIVIYSVWVFLNILTEKFYWSAGQLVLGATKGTKDVAIYSVAIHLKDMFYMFSTAISTVLLPKVTSMVAKGASDKEMSDLFIKTGRIQYAIISLILVGFILIGRPFVHLWAGEDYDNAFLIALMLFLVTSIPLIQNMGITILQARNQMKFRCLVIFFVSAISVLIGVPVSKQFGMIGYAMVTAIAIVIAYTVILNVYYYKKIGIDIPLFWKNILKMSFPVFTILALGEAILNYVCIDTWFELLIASFVILTIFSMLSITTSLNDYERILFMTPLRKIRNKTK